MDARNYACGSGLPRASLPVTLWIYLPPELAVRTLTLYVVASAPHRASGSGFHLRCAFGDSTIAQVENGWEVSRK